MKKKIIIAVSALCLCAGAASAAETVKIGFITTFSGPGAVLGKHMKDGADLAMEALGSKIGGLDAEILYGDDQQKPDVGRQVAEQMLKRDKVNFVSGIVWSNVMLSVYQPVIKSGTILVGASAGPHEIAGKMCAPNFFSTGWQNDQSAEAMGKYMTDKGISDVYLMAPNYAAGRDMIAGFKRYYKGKILAEVYTKLDETDYQAELTQIRAANAKAVFVFYPGGLGIQFVKQYDQAGLHGTIPLYSVFTMNEVILNALGATAEGNYESGYWSPYLENPSAKKFVSDFRNKYGYLPSDYSAASFDAVNLINSAVTGTKGNLDPKALAKEMKKANFSSVRGDFSFNSNHFPIQNFHLFQIVKDAGGSFVRRAESTIFTGHKDAYYTECSMAAQ